MIGLMLVAQIGIVARAPDTVSSCLPFELAVAVRSSGAAAPRIELPASGALQLLRSSLVSRLERDAQGRPVLITEATFLVAAGAAGRVVLPPLTVTAGGVSTRSAALVVNVRAAERSSPQVLVRSTLDAGPGRRTDTLYVGQQADYVVDVQLNEAARQRLRHNPTFYPPEMPAVLTYDLAPPRPLEREGRQCFETLSYRRALFPLFPGTTLIPPATLTYSLPLSTSFFSREEQFEVRTDSVRFVAIEPPAPTRPPDFAGAVGSVSASTTLGAPAGRMGDPVVLTVRLAGRGNVKLLPRPLITIDWAAITVGDERVTVDTSAARVTGTKEFDWLLTPRRAGRLGVPVIRYPYFDPTRAAYDVALTDSLFFEVATAALASADTVPASRPSIRRAIRAEEPPPMPSRGWYWLMLGLAPVPAAVRRMRARRRQRASTRGAVRRLRALGAARRPPSPRELRRAYLDSLQERVPAVGADAPARLPLGRVLRRAGVTDDTAHAAELVLGRLDAAAFSPAGVVEQSLVARALEIAAAVDIEAVRPAVGPRDVSAMLLVATLFAGTASGLPEGVRRTFDDGVRAYEGGEFGAAQRLFARAAARAPRAVDAWANLGAAAWARDDTAHAVLGWQRALRLDPLDGEMRERLAALQPPLLGAPAYVPPVSVNAIALGAMVLWVGAWLALALQAVRRTPHLRPLAGGALVVAIAAFAAALELQDRASVRGLGVVRGSRELRESPTPGSAAVAVAASGEVGSMGVREGAWVRIALDGARAGWLPAAAVLPLDDGGVD